MDQGKTPLQMSFQKHLKELREISPRNWRESRWMSFRLETKHWNKHVHPWTQDLKSSNRIGAPMASLINKNEWFSIIFRATNFYLQDTSEASFYYLALRTAIRFSILFILMWEAITTAGQIFVYYAISIGNKTLLEVILRSVLSTRHLTNNNRFQVAV